MKRSKTHEIKLMVRDIPSPNEPFITTREILIHLRRVELPAGVYIQSAKKVRTYEQGSDN
jgi:hypothetical protein